MSGNPVTCGNCHTENSPENDLCSSCGQPLTRSAEESLVENQQAQARGGVFTGTADPSLGGAANTFVPGTGSTVKDGLPTD